MKVEINVKKECDIRFLIVKAGVQYFEDATVNGIEDTKGNLIPCRDGDLWCPVIEIETGKIRNWVDGTMASIHYKVCDCLGYEIQDERGQTVLYAEDGYVPTTLSPRENGYGDYIIMDIDGNGQIVDWKFNFSDFESSEA